MQSPDLNQFAIDSIEFSDVDFHLLLKSGKVLKLPLSQGRFANIRLLNARQRNHWLLVDNNFGVYWADVKRPEEFSDNAMINSLDLVWEKITEQALDNLSKREWDFDQLSELEKDIVALWRLEADVYNGGFMQFFCNWGEFTCQRALSVLQKIHAEESYKIVSKMRALINRFEDDPQAKSLMDIYKLLTQAEKTEMDSLDESYWQHSDGLVKKAVGYFAEYFQNHIQVNNDE